MTEAEGSADHIRNALQILEGAVPRDRVILDALPDGIIEREDVMVISKEALIALRIRLVAALNQIEAYHCSLPASISEALNSGDGTYRP